MSKLEKLVKQILNGKPISYKEAETLLKKLNFDLRVRGSHHVFGKPNYEKNVSLKKRNQLMPYQVKLLQEVLEDHGY